MRRRSFFKHWNARGHLKSHLQEFGGTLQELNSIWDGKNWDDARRGWLDPVLVRKARWEEMQYVKKHVVYEEGAKRSERTLSKERRSRWVPKKKRHWTRRVHRNIATGGRDARHLRGIFHRQVGDRALGDRRTESALLCYGDAQNVRRTSREGRRRAWQSAVRIGEQELVRHP